MTDFSWEYVARTTRQALAEIGRVTVATIAQAVDPGVYFVAPDTIYEVRALSDGSISVRRNGLELHGGSAVEDPAAFLPVAADFAATPVADVASTLSVGVMVDVR